MAEARVLGLDKLDKRLKAMAKEASGEQIEAALVVGGLVIMSRAKELAPVLSGTLRRSIHIGGYTDKSPDFGSSPNGAEYDDIGGNVGEGTQARILIGTNIEYGAAVEFGTGRQRPKPYLRPAFDQEKEQALSDVAETLSELIQTGAGA
jgi:HK97 gp10 family phage protein